MKAFISLFPGFRIRIHFLRIRIRIQRIRMEANTDPDADPDPIRIQGFNDQKLKKNNSWKNCNLPIPRPPQSMSRLQKKPPAHKRQEAIQHFKTWIFSTFAGHFCPPGSGSVFKLRIRIQWSDWIRIQYGSGSETLIVSDPQGPHVFRPPGSGSISQRYGSGSSSGSFYHPIIKQKNKKNLDSYRYCFVTSFGLFIFEKWDKFTLKINQQKNFFKQISFLWSMTKIAGS